MTPTLDDSIKDLLNMIDQSLGQMNERNIVTGSEVSDLLLDMRGLVSAVEEAANVRQPA